jgi:hypothetical protein
MEFVAFVRYTNGFTSLVPGRFATSAEAEVAIADYIANNRPTMFGPVAGVKVAEVPAGDPVAYMDALLAM